MALPHESRLKIAVIRVYRRQINTGCSPIIKHMAAKETYVRANHKRINEMVYRKGDPNGSLVPILST
jgi:uncharacterized protein YceK